VRDAQNDDLKKIIYIYNMKLTTKQIGKILKRIAWFKEPQPLEPKSKYNFSKPIKETKPLR